MTPWTDATGEGADACAGPPALLREPLPTPPMLLPPPLDGVALLDRPLLGEETPPPDEPPLDEKTPALLDGVLLPVTTALGAGDAVPGLGDDVGALPEELAGDDGIWPLATVPGPALPPTGPPTWLLFPPVAAPVVAFALPPS